MDQQTQQSAPQPAPQQQVPGGTNATQAPAGQAVPQKKSKVWLWILGGCLTIIVIGALIIGGLVWWGARKAKKFINENQPKLEEMQKGADEWQEKSKDWQEEMEKAQQEMEKNLPNNSVPR